MTLVHAGQIARVDPAGRGSARASSEARVQLFAVDNPGCRPLPITPGADGALWFTPAVTIGSAGSAPTC